MDYSVSILIVSLNRREDLLKGLESIRADGYPAQIVVVDGGSQDGSADAVASYFPEVKLIRLHRNMGACIGRNIGLANCTGSIVVLLDDDSFIPPGTLSKTVECFRRNPRLGAMGCQVLNPADDSEDIWWSHLGEGDPEAGYPSPSFKGCGAAIRREVALEVGGFSEDYFAYGEEGDLCIRILDAGHEVRFFPKIPVYHRLSPGYRSFSGNYVRLVTRNSLWFLWRYLPIWSAAPRTGVLLARFMRDSLRWRSLRAYLAGIWECLLGMPAILRQRQPVSRQTVQKVMGRPF